MNKGLNLLIVLFYLKLVFANNDIRIYKIARCNYKTSYPVTVKNVNFELKSGIAYVSGSLTTNTTISSPVQASLYVERCIKPLNIWIPIPCVDSLGSCTYDNLCHWGKSLNDTCPEHFVRDKVPCRCPILEGTYELEPDNSIPLFKTPEKIEWKLGELQLSSPATGTYSVKATITSGKKLLTCYNFYLDYNDSYKEDNVVLNEIWPFVEVNS